MSDQFTAPERFRAELEDVLLEHAAALPGSSALPRSAARPTAAPRSADRRVRARRLVPALALAALIAAVVLILRSGGALAPQPATAASVLKASAAALDRLGGSRTLGPGDYLYTRTAVWWRYAYGSHPYVARGFDEQWLARDGHGRSRYDVVGLSGAGANRGLPFARSTDTRLPRSSRPFIISTLPSPGILLSYAQLRHLPTDPTGLAAALNRLAAQYHVNRLFPQRDLNAAIRWGMLRGLAQAPTSAALRAALYRVLAATPGIRLLGHTRDSIGRYGMEVAIDVEGARLAMILDPQTGALLQTSRTLLHRSRAYNDGKLPPGLINRATYLASGIVTSTRARVP